LIFIIISFILYKNKLISDVFFLFFYFFNGINLVLTGSKNNFLIFNILTIYFIYKLLIENNKNFLILFLFLIILCSLFYLLWIEPHSKIWFLINKIKTEDKNNEIIQQNEIKKIVQIYNLEEYKITSLNIRREIYNTALEVIRKHPLGVGPYVFQKDFLRNNATITKIFGEKTIGFNSHNILLQMWLDFGIVGFLLLFGICYLFLNFKSDLRIYWGIILLGNLIDYFLSNVFIIYLTIMILGFSLSELKNEEDLS